MIKKQVKKQNSFQLILCDSDTINNLITKCKKISHNIKSHLRPQFFKDSARSLSKTLKN